MPREKLSLSEFDYHLPKELIAQYPCAKRGGSRLLVLERDKKKISHKRFSAIVDYFSKGDCLVLNNTKVVCARIIGRREKVSPNLGGGKQEIFLLEKKSKDTFRVLARPAYKLTEGTKIFFDDNRINASVLADEGRTKIIKFSGNGNIEDFWSELGQLPLPPYIKREPQAVDKIRYQTVFASEDGACASPTAGLHFTKELLQEIERKGVNVVYLTLHINYGTFAPVKSEDITKHKMHKEYFILPEDTAEQVNRTRNRGKRIFSVGTTTVRVLESCAQEKGGKFFVNSRLGWTDLFIYPSYRFKIVDVLITNFHFPKSTLLMLVSAFAGKKLVFQAYQEAIDKQYRFFSYGDAMLIL